MDLIKRFTREGLNHLQNAVDAVKTRLESYDFSQIEREMEKISQKWTDLFDEWKRETNKYVVRVPYNADTQTIKSTVDGNTFRVKVKLDSVDNRCEDSTTIQSYTYRHESTIPQAFLNGSILQKYLKDKKEMLFIFQKPVVREETVGNVDDLIASINATTEEEIPQQIIDATALDPNSLHNNGGVEVTATTEPYEVDETVDAENEEELREESEESRYESMNQAIWQKFLDGKSYRQIAREVGVSDKTVARRIKKMIG